MQSIITTWSNKKWLLHRQRQVKVKHQSNVKQRTCLLPRAGTKTNKKRHKPGNDLRSNHCCIWLINETIHLHCASKKASWKMDTHISSERVWVLHISWLRQGYAAPLHTLQSRVSQSLPFTASIILKLTFRSTVRWYVVCAKHSAKKSENLIINVFDIEEPKLTRDKQWEPYCKWVEIRKKGRSPPMSVWADESINGRLVGCFSVKTVRKTLEETLLTCPSRLSIYCLRDGALFLLFLTETE